MKNKCWFILYAEVQLPRDEYITRSTYIQTYIYSKLTALFIIMRQLDLQRHYTQTFTFHERLFNIGEKKIDLTTFVLQNK